MGVKELEEELIKARKTLNQDIPLMLSLLDDLTKMTKGVALAGHLETLVSLYQRIGYKEEAEQLMPRMLKMNPNAHDARMKFIKQKASQPDQIMLAQTEFMRLEAALAMKFLGAAKNPETEEEDEKLKSEFEQLNFVVQANLPQLSIGDFI